MSINLSLLLKYSEEDALQILHYLVSMINKSKNDFDYRIVELASEYIIRNDLKLVGDQILESLNINEIKSDEVKDNYIVETYEYMENFDSFRSGINLEHGKRLLALLNNHDDVHGKVAENEHFYINSKGITAMGEYSDERMIVFQGSKMIINTASSFDKQMSGYAKLREDLIGSRIVIKKDGEYVFTKNYAFNSPSSAASVILGRSANGWTEWKRNDGKTLDEVKR